MSDKRYLQLKAAAEHPACPWGSVQQVRGAYYRALPRKDSSDLVVTSGDAEMLKCFIQLAKGGPLLVDMTALAKLMERRRVNEMEAA